MVSRKDLRLGLLLAVAVSALAVTALFAAQARADVEFDNTTAHASPYGSTSDPRPGAHGDLITGAYFKYTSGDGLKSVLIDLPYGGVGNPNAVPYADRCTLDQFNSDTCPDASVIGTATTDATAHTIVGDIPLTNQSGPIYIIQTTPEVPVTVGAKIVPSIGDPVRTIAKYYPVTSGPDGDFRIRTQIDAFPTEVTGVPVFGTVPITIDRYEQKLNGVLASGVPFITNPTRCDTWMSYGYAQAINTNSNANSDPFQTGTNNFLKSDGIPTAPDCSHLAPFAVSADAKLTGTQRGGPAGLTATVNIPNLGIGDQGAATAKTITTVLPDAVNIDVQQLGRECARASFTAGTCPASAKIGDVNITTPMIVEGLHGNVYMVKNASGAGLPDVGLDVNGVISFKQLGSSRYVNGTQLQTTFDNIPAVGFSSLTLSITGGTGSLLRIDSCPTSNTTPADGGPTKFTVTSYQGQTATFNSPTSYGSPDCTSYRVAMKKISRCVKRGGTLKVAPSIATRSQVRYLRVSLKGSKTRTDKRSPFSVKLKVSKKLKKGKRYVYKARVNFKASTKYPKGRTITKKGSFRVCR